MQLEYLSSGVATSGDGTQSGMETSELVEGSLSDSTWLVILSLSWSRCQQMTVPSFSSTIKVTAHDCFSILPGILAHVLLLKSL